MAGPSQCYGNAAGAPEPYIVEGPALAPLSGPRHADDSPHYGGDNDMDDAYHQADVWDNAPFPAAPGSVNRDSVG